jgi:hypothetical protein
MLKGISNSSIMNDTSHITQMLKDKIERLESQGKIKSNFTGSWGTGEFKLIERADSKAKQSIKEGRDSQLLLPVTDLKNQWKKKG